MTADQEGGPVRQGLVDEDRRSGRKTSLSIDTIGDLKFYWGTTGILGSTSTKDVYLTGNGEVGGESLYTKVPQVVVYADESAEAGGFPRGQGPVGPGYAYSGDPHSDFLVKWDTTNKKWFVRVDNTTGKSRDFAVSVMGV